MKNFTMRTYNDSYLYSNKIANGSNPKSKNDKAILDFITTSHRIDKHSDAFRGVIEDVKRQQTSAVLLAILMHENVILCINNAPMPRAFTVFDAKDSKSNGKPKVFIDVTGKIDYKDGYYVARRNEIDKLCALLFDAMIYMLYRNYPYKLMNATIVNNATACYVSMFTYIIDYLRIIGYSQNKTKISYIIGLYFLKSHCGIELDDYAKSIAAKVAGISIKDSRAYDLYIESEDMFENIGTFLPALCQTFKLKQLDLPVFVQRWMKSFGTGTEYAIELFTDFACLVVNAYTGCYIVQQRQIEIACGSDSMIKFANGILRAGVDSFDMRAFMNESDLSLYEVHSRNSEDLAKAITLKNSIDESKLLVNTFSNKEEALTEAKEIIKTCKEARIEDKIDKFAANSIANGIRVAYEYCISLITSEEAPIYESGSLINISKAFKNQITDKQRYELETVINRDIDQLREIIKEAGASKETNSKISKTILEFREIQQYI